MHAQGDLALPVLRDVALAVAPGECLALVGPSGAGKSTLLRSLYGNYRAAVRLDPGPPSRAWVELVGAEPRVVLDVRRRTLGFVSQFLRVIPRVGAVDVVAEPMVRRGAPTRTRRAAAPSSCSACSAFPQRLWALPPATFSGGEQQRVNIARSLIADYPILLLDEPTASLDAANRDGVIDLIRQAPRSRRGDRRHLPRRRPCAMRSPPVCTTSRCPEHSHEHGDRPDQRPHRHRRCRVRRHRRACAAAESPR